MMGDVGLEAHLVPTRSAQEMAGRLRHLVAQGAPLVTVAGGDGTVSLAAQELAYSGTALGILPLGTANNFATALRLPQDLPSALRVLKEGVVRAVDLGRVGERYFTEAAGVGFFADALALYGVGSNKDPLRALYALARTASSLRARRLELTVDGETYVQRALMCTALNTYRMAHALPVAPDAKVTDGALDVVIVGDLSFGELLPYYRAVRAQTHLGLPKVTHLRAKEVRLEARRKLNVHLDDQVVRLNPVRLGVAPGALKVLLPRL